MVARTIKVASIPAARDPVAFLMKLIEVQFIADEQHDQEAYCHARSQTENIDKGEALSLEQVAGGDFQEVFEHGSWCFGDT